MPSGLGQRLRFSRFREFLVASGARSPLDTLLLFAIFVFPLATFAIPNAESVIAGLLMLYGLGAGWGSGAWRSLDRGERWIALAWMGMFLVSYAAFMLGKDTSLGFRILGRDLRWAVFVPIYLAVRRLHPSPRLLKWALLLGAGVAAVQALTAVAGQGWSDRPSGDLGVAIVFGDLALLTGFLAAPFWMGDSTQPKAFRMLGAGASILLGLLASVLSQSRGGWLAIPALAALLAYAWLPRKGLKRALFAGCALAAVFLLLVGITPIGARIRHAAADVISAIRARPDRSGALGCMDRRRYLSGLAQALTVVSDREAVGIQVVSTRRVLDQSGWAHRCRGGYAIALNNRSRQETARIAIPQLEPLGAAAWPIEMLVRGRGVLSAGSGPGAIRAFSDGSFQPVRVMLNAPGQRPSLEVPPESGLQVIPIQLYPGEYSDYPLETSLGLRLEMWRAAWRMFREHPLLGVGTGAYRETADAWGRSGYLIRNATGFDHPHSDILDVLASQGIVGLVVLLAVYVLPFGAFSQGLRSDEPGRRAFGLAGTLLVMGMVIGGFTETLFIHSAVISWYTVLMAILYAGCMGERRAF